MELTFIIIGWALFLIGLIVTMIYYFLKADPQESDETSHKGRYKYTHPDDEGVIF